MSLSYRPLVYFWIAEYSDGTAFPQFDPETGKENRFADVDQARLKRFGWYPFSLEITKKIFEAEGIIVLATANPPHVIELKDGEKLVGKRENTIRLNMKGNSVGRGETVYILGVEGEKGLRIREDGSVE